MGMQSALHVPLINKQGMIGLLSVFSQAEAAYSHNDQSLLQQIAAMLASAIENRKLFTSTQNSLAEVKRLYDVSARLSIARSAAEILAAVVSVIPEESFQNAVLFRVESDSHNQAEALDLLAAWRSSETDLPAQGKYYLRDYPWLKQQLGNEQVLLVQDIVDSYQVDPITRNFYKRFSASKVLNLPLRLDNQWVGLISLHWQTHLEVEAVDERVYQSLMELAAVVLNNLLLHEQTRQQAEREAMVNRIRQRIQGTLNTDSALQVAIQELGKALHPKSAQIILGDIDKS